MKKYLFINVFFFLVMAACAISNVIKSSLGPVGLDKLLVDEIGVRNYVKYFKEKIKICIVH